MDQDNTSRSHFEAFEFPLDDIPEREPLYSDAVTEFFRQQVLNLLDVLVLTDDGQPVRIDGFAFSQDTSDVYALCSKESCPEGHSDAGPDSQADDPGRP